MQELLNKEGTQDQNTVKRTQKQWRKHDLKITVSQLKYTKCF